MGWRCQDWAKDDGELGLAQLLIVPPLVLCPQGLGNNSLNCERSENK